LSAPSSIINKPYFMRYSKTRGFSGSNNPSNPSQDEDFAPGNAFQENPQSRKNHKKTYGCKKNKTSNRD